MIQKLTLSVLPENLTICKLDSRHNIPDWAMNSNFYAITRTTDELSIVCDQAYVPADIQHESGWRAFKVEGPLDFALTGILANLATLLADVSVALFAISTFDTDYVLVKAEKISIAIAAFESGGHIVQVDDT
ncbi:MAG: ACT domain-containing protein [Chloroflexota bacterium]